MAHQSLTAKENRPSSSDVDLVVNAAFTAFSATLGTVFQTGSRNIRGIVSNWCPLAQSISDISTADFRKSYLTSHFFDRYLYAAETDPKPLRDTALQKFADNVERGWVMNGVLSRTGQDAWLDSVIAQAAIYAQRILGELDYPEFLRRVRHGPNSTTTVARKDAFLDVKTFDLTGTRGAMHHFTNYLAWDHSYAEFLRDAYRDLPAEWQKVNVVEGNNLSFVPKKFDKLRTMCAEPTANMFFQLAAGSCIAECLRLRANIDLASQPGCHQRMAMLASLYPEIEDATVDWSEASDRIWIVLVQRVLALCPGWFSLLIDLRSKTSTFTDPDCCDASRVFELPMIGTMGNGFTFPLQTLMFYCLLRGLAHVEGERELGISVFGDDCLVPCALMPAVNRLAFELGWKLNGSKSFSSGDFRESCGADCYRGMDVRPFYIERPTDFRKNSLKAWVYVAFNGMVRALKPDKHPSDPDHLCRWLVETFKRWDLGRIHVVPPHFSDASGIRYFSQSWPFNGFAKTNLFSGPDYYERTLVDHGPHYGEWRFKCLQNQPGQREVIVEYPYYHRWLRQQVIQDVTDWRTSTRLEECSADPWEGFAACKRVQYRTKTVHTHTWEYWLM